MEQSYLAYLLNFQKNANFIASLPKYDLYQDIQNETHGASS